MPSSGAPHNASRHQSTRGTELIHELTDVFTQIRLLHARGLDVIADMVDEQVAHHAGYSSLPVFLVELLHVAPKKATSLVAQASQTAETLTPTGHRTPAPLPRTRAALHAGLIDGEHIDAITNIIKQLPTWASTADRELVEKTLADTAHTAPPHVVKRHGEELLARLDQDGTDPHLEDTQAEPVNLFRYKRSRDGRMRFSGDIDPKAPNNSKGCSATSANLSRSTHATQNNATGTPSAT